MLTGLQSLSPQRWEVPLPPLLLPCTKSVSPRPRPRGQLVLIASFPMDEKEQGGSRKGLTREGSLCNSLSE